MKRPTWDEVTAEMPGSGVSVSASLSISDAIITCIIETKMLCFAFVMQKCKVLCRSQCKTKHLATKHTQLSWLQTCIIYHLNHGIYLYSWIVLWVEFRTSLNSDHTAR